MGSVDRPKLRPLSGRRVDHQGRAFVALEDSLGLFSGQVLIPFDLFRDVVRHFDGRSSLDEIRGRVRLEAGQSISPQDLEALVDRLDRAMVLEGAAYSDFVDRYSRMKVRPPSHAGRSYPSDVTTLRRELDAHFEGPRGAGRPGSGGEGASPTGSFRGVLSPHIDFGRGGPIYSHAYRRIVERSDAEVFVILGVAHQYCKNRFALTRKDFQTPLGTARTNLAFVDHLVGDVGGHLFEDELAHRTEHSIEFQVVFLQHALGDRRDFSIVPILVGSFHDLMKAGEEPSSDPEVGRMIGAIRSAEAARGGKVAYIGGIDLCHVGPEFGDPSPVDDPTLGVVRGFDEAMLDRAADGDAAGWFSRAAEVDNRWRVCGLAATYTMLEAIGPSRGEVLGYDQAVNPKRTCCVTFASVAFEADPGPEDA